MSKIILILLLFYTATFAVNIDRKLQKFISDHPGQNVKVWIFFKDKGPLQELSFSKEYNRISSKAMKRRSKMSSDAITFSDYPLYDRYLEQIKDHLIKIRKKSRWLNAVSALINPDRLDEITDYDFINDIRFMVTYKKRVDKENNLSFNKTFTTPEDSQFYGNSLLQLEQIRVTDMHKMGYTGEGVTIAMLDDGFNLYDQHIVFEELNVLDTYDFVNNDMDVTDRDSLPRQGWHGTTTLSVIAGYSPGKLIGAAYNATFLLAKTEIDKDEIQQEEDNWVAGLEWAESKGADIINSSLGYWDWYTWEDMDGQTAITSLATIEAEAKGLIVVNAAGNEGRDSAPNTLGAPADGLFVITVGAVSPAGNYESFSSYGPTADGRIKPDVSALGNSVYLASDSKIDGFSYKAGTSYSSPLTAGALALLLQAYPDLTPPDVREAIKKTASQAMIPDNFLGYGIIDIFAAYQYVKDGFLPDDSPVEHALNSPNPFSLYTRIEYTVKAPSWVSVNIYDVSGRRVLSFPKKIISGNDYEIIRGEQLGANGIYFYSVTGKEFQSGKRIFKHGKFLYFK